MDGDERVVKPGFNRRVYEVVRGIPPGTVLTYGDVARILGSARVARKVGQALAALRDDDVPWHRVVNARGEISVRGGDGPALQRLLLEHEGVVFDEEGRVDLRRFRADSPVVVGPQPA